MTCTPRALTLSIAAVASVVVIGKIFIELSYIGIVPPEIGISYPIARGEMGFIRESCGAAVYRIDSKTSLAMSKSGINYLPKVSQARWFTDRYYTFGPWLPTPQKELIGDDNTILGPGLGCANIDNDLREQIEQASRVTGSYYAYGDEQVLLIIPALRIVVLSYDG